MLDRWLAAVTDGVPRVVLADGDDPRVLAAAVTLTSAGVVEPVVVSHEPRDIAPGGKKVEVVPAAGDALATSLELVASGAADACVAGAALPTSEVVRAALKTVGAADEGGLVSSSFFFLRRSGDTMAYGDCGVVPDPTAEQLAAIAIATARSYEQLAGLEPRVAMLSFSTHGSADHPSVAKVRRATDLVRRAAPDIAVDGELQFDAAFIPEVAAMKAPGSAVAGQANVFIFPNLDAGNIAYKITERMAGARAFGPLLQGLRRPVHDLSRGCSIDDIVAVSTIAGFQALQTKETVT